MCKALFFSINKIENRKSKYISQVTQWRQRFSQFTVLRAFLSRLCHVRFEYVANETRDVLSEIGQYIKPKIKRKNAYMSMRISGLFLKHSFHSLPFVSEAVNSHVTK